MKVDCLGTATAGRSTFSMTATRCPECNRSFPSQRGVSNHLSHPKSTCGAWFQDLIHRNIPQAQEYSPSPPQAPYTDLCNSDDEGNGSGLDDSEGDSFEFLSGLGRLLMHIQRAPLAIWALIHAILPGSLMTQMVR